MSCPECQKKMIRVLAIGDALDVCQCPWCGTVVVADEKDSRAFSPDEKRPAVLQGDIVRSHLCLMCNSEAALEFIAPDLRQELAERLTAPADPPRHGGPSFTQAASIAEKSAAVSGAKEVLAENRHLATNLEMALAKDKAETAQALCRVVHFMAGPVPQCPACDHMSSTSCSFWRIGPSRWECPVCGFRVLRTEAVAALNESKGQLQEDVKVWKKWMDPTIEVEAK
jgi:hypothetical protein